MALTPNLRIGFMSSSFCGGDDDDDDASFTGDDTVTSSAAVHDDVVLARCGVASPPDPVVAVVHLGTPGCSATGDGVDVVWKGGGVVRQSNRLTVSVSGGSEGAILRRSGLSSYGVRVSTTLTGMR